MIWISHARKIDSDGIPIFFAPTASNISDCLKAISEKLVFRWRENTSDCLHDIENHTFIDVSSTSKDTLSLFIDK